MVDVIFTAFCIAAVVDVVVIFAVVVVMLVSLFLLVSRHCCRYG